MPIKSQTAEIVDTIPKDTLNYRYHYEAWDEFYYCFEIDPDPCPYAECINRFWINTKMDGTGQWIYIPHTYKSGSKTCPAMAVIENVTDAHWAGDNE